ncbi:MAG: hypothetical protein SFX73_30865 [Kofleriaceae bacterium]|nr:hypothetical protein [Kofleriaceae bacterium]
MKSVLVLVLGGACATVTSVCPPGTRLVTEGAPITRAQYCTNQTSTMAQISTPGRTFASTLGIGAPTQMAAGVEGPYTGFHANGRTAAHGTYVDLGGRSVPDGIWAFWHPSGKRAALGRYREGHPVGCFAHWSEDGALSVGLVENGTLREVACVPPSLDTFIAIEQKAYETPRIPRADFTLSGFAGGGDFGARNDTQHYNDPSFRAALAAAARVRIGPVRFGPTAGYRYARESTHKTVTFGGQIALGWRSPHPRLDLEVALEAGSRHLTVLAARGTRSGTDKLRFWDGYGAAELAAAWALSDKVQARLGLRLDGVPTHDVEAEVTYCVGLLCDPTVTETWHLGGFSYGATFGVRFVL